VTTNTSECAELTKARRLVPEIAARAAQSEQDRRLAADTVQSMVESGLVQMAIPNEYGGLESHLSDTLKVVEEISYADASAGWCLMNYQTTAFGAAQLPPSAATGIFAGPERTVPAGVLAPTGRGRFVDGGMIVSGRWAFASGCDNANWLLAAVVITDDDDNPQFNLDGSPQVLLPFFKRNQFEILDTWRVSGLRASGSHDVEVRDELVQEGYWLSLTDPPVVSGTLFQFPVVSTFPPAVAAVALGVARAALDCFVDITRSKIPIGGTTPLRELGSAQIDVARAEALTDSARSYMYETVETLWAIVEQGQPATIDARRRVRLAGIHAADTAASAVDLLYNAAGASSIADTCPLQRHFRDVHVVTQHMHVSGGGYERMGKLRLTDVLDGLL